MRRPLSLVSVLMAIAPISAAQELVYELVAPAAVKQYGQAVAATADLDDDGWPDFALSAYGSRVELRSGRTGALLALRESSADGYGETLAPVGDVDGDGVPDLAVGTPGPLWGGPCYEWCGGSEPGFVEILSGIDASLILRIDEPTGADRELGTAVLGLGDIDGDGTEDIVASAPAGGLHAVWVWFGLADPVAGSVFAFSGADGSVLWENAGEVDGELFGVALASLPDEDGDGVDELAVGANVSETVSVLSGATGQVLRRLHAPNYPGTAFPLTGFGSSLASVAGGTPNGGTALLVGRRTAYSQSHGAVLIDPRNVEVLAVVSGPGAFGSGMGSSVAAGDIDGDGLPEFLLGNEQRSELSLFERDGARINGLGRYDDAHFPNVPFPGVASSAAVLGDVTGDGVDDFVMGEPASGGDEWSYGRVRVFAGGAGPWTNLGHAHPDGRYPPEVQALLTRTPQTGYSPDAKLELRVIPWLPPTDVPAVPTPGRLVIGPPTAGVPLHGGVLVPEPHVVIPFEAWSFYPIPPVVSSTLPSDLPPGLSFAVQAIVGVPGSPGGVRFSDAWLGVLP